MMSLPILEVLPEVKKKLSDHNLIILQAPPGAGKSTVLPLELIKESWLKGKKIVMLEPRRLAARLVALRMASLMEEEIGKTIGYRVRFDNRLSEATRIEVVTEGILTRMLQTDNLLEDYGLVIFDEFHERNLNSDLALALCHHTQQILRKDLRILIMSATIDAEKLSIALNNAPVISCEGRQFQVSIHYLNFSPDEYLPERIVKSIFKVRKEHEGDILVFLPGAGEIRSTARLLEEADGSLNIHSLYGDLPQLQQQKALLPDPEGRRKIILATSIAETSLTIEGVKIVIDSGLSRIPKFDVRNGMTRLETVKVTKDTADQRAGRAGRLGPGNCYRLWNEGLHVHLKSHRNAEILDADLSSLLLELKDWGIRNPDELTWVTNPPVPSLKQATELLNLLGAIRNEKITERGKEMLRLPTHPRIAHMLLETTDRSLAADIAALLEEHDPLNKEAGADLTLRLEVLRKWRKREPVNADKNLLERIERLALAWRKLFNSKTDNAMPSEADVGKLLAAAYPERIARQVSKNSTRYRLVNGRVVKLSESDPLIREEFLSVAHLDAGSNEGKIFLAAPMTSEHLMQFADMKEVILWDHQKNMLTGRTETYLGNITIDSSPLKKINDRERIPVICKAIRQTGLADMLDWNIKILHWQKRIMSLRSWRPNEPWPDVSDNNLLESLEVWLSPWLSNLNKKEELRRLNIEQILIGLIPYELIQKVDLLAPEFLSVPSGSMIHLNYSPDGNPPEMAVGLQEIFGLLKTPAVNEGRTKVILHLLSPAKRPVQVTQDLHSFWSTTYSEVRKELRMRYPKHSWPEDPWTAKAVRGVVKKRRE